MIAGFVTGSMARVARAVALAALLAIGGMLPAAAQHPSVPCVTTWQQGQTGRTALFRMRAHGLTTGNVGIDRALAGRAAELARQNGFDGYYLFIEERGVSVMRQRGVVVHQWPYVNALALLAARSTQFPPAAGVFQAAADIPATPRINECPADSMTGSTPNGQEKP
jgi:hypothetical protein